MIVKLNDMAKRVCPSIDTDFAIQSIGRTKAGGYAFNADQLELAGMTTYYLWLCSDFDTGLCFVNPLAVDQV